MTKGKQAASAIKTTPAKRKLAIKEGGVDVYWTQSSEDALESESSSESDDILAPASRAPPEGKTKKRKKNPLPLTTTPTKFSKEFQPHHCQKYEILKKKEIVPHYTLHRENMQLLGISSRVRKTFTNVGWESWLCCDNNVYEEMSLEILASYTFNVSPGYSLATPNVIQFFLNGTNRSMSITEFGLQIGYLRIEDL